MLKCIKHETCTIRDSIKLSVNIKMYLREDGKLTKSSKMSPNECNCKMQMHFDLPQNPLFYDHNRYCISTLKKTLLSHAYICLFICNFLSGLSGLSTSAN